MRRLIPVLLCLWATPSFGALTFAGSSTDKVAIASPQTFGANSKFTIWTWFNMTSSPTNGQGTTRGGSDLLVFFNTYFCGVDRDTTDASATFSTDGTFFTAGTWYFFAMTYSESAGCRVYRGTLTSSVAEVTYNGTPTVGSGNTTANSSALDIWNRGGSNALPAKVAWWAWHDDELSVGQLRALQFRPRKLSSTKVLMRFGANGTTSQPDQSGNVNTGTITGATLSADHVPLPY